MKIYFAGSIRGGREDGELYEKIIMLLSGFGEVLTGEDKTSQQIYRDDIERLEQAHVLIAEVTTPSLGVGYEIGQAEVMCKPTLCLYKVGAKNALSAMIDGNPNLVVKKYKTFGDIGPIFDEFFKKSALPAKEANPYCCGGGCCQDKASI